MLKMKVKVFVSAFIAALTASLIHGSRTDDVKLLASPGEPEVRVPAGKPFNISCRLSGGDQSKISSLQWFDPEGNVIRDGNPSVVKRENNLLFLTFTAPTESKSNGTYKCQALYDDDHNLQYTVNIVFYGPEPEFEKKFENITVIQGERVEIYCNATGETPMTYSWTDQNSNPISDIAGFDAFIYNFGDGSWLIIKSARFQDQGMYTCSASNKHGLLSKLYFIGVYPKSQEDISGFGDIEFVNITTNSVQVRIPVEGSATNIEVKYEETYEKISNNRSFTKALDDTYTVTDLIPGGQYNFQFRISDNNGNWSKTFQATLLPDAPEIMIHGLGMGSIELGWFVPTDNPSRGTIDRYEIKYYTVRMQSGNYWVPSECAVTIETPSCSGSGYTISGLSEKVYYQIEVRGHTDAGYGEPAKTKIYLQ